MTITLRAHHLLCVLTYSGKGYSPAFVTNFDSVVRRLQAGEALEIVEGPDTLCAPLCAEEGDGAHCHGASVQERDRRALRDLTPLLVGAIGSGSPLVLDAARVARLRSAFVRDTIRSACADCPWHTMCTHVAASDYVGAMLHQRLSI